jgi:hypothetical protein
MNTIDELAIALLKGELRYLAASVEQHYKPPRWEGKTSGGTRRIDEPRARLMAVQKLIKRHLAPLIDSPIAYGISGLSHVNAAEQHPGKGYLGKLDALNFFPSITEGLVREALRSEGFGGEALDLLVKLVTLKGCLRQGPPSSPAVANLVLKDFDRQVADMATQLGVSVSRSTDDFVTKGPTWISVKRLHDFINEQLRQLGLRVNWSKYSITPHHQCQLAHGLTVNRQPCIPKRKKTAGEKLSRERVRGSVRRAKRVGFSKVEQQRLNGQLGYMKPLHAHEVQRLLDALRDGGS